MTKEYEMECPNPECLTTLTLEMDPQDGETESIECPECRQEWDYVFDAKSDTVTLLALEEDEEEEEEGDAGAF